MFKYIDKWKDVKKVKRARDEMINKIIDRYTGKLENILIY